MKKALIIGGGIAGCAAAHQLSLQGGWDVTLVEKGRHLGAGNYTHFYGGHPYTFGPRHFLTQNEEVYNYYRKYRPLHFEPPFTFSIGKKFSSSDDTKTLLGILESTCSIVSK